MKLPHVLRRISLAIAVPLLLTACGGGGAEPAPAVSIAGSPATLTVGSPVSLSWSSTNATSCSASGAWSGSKSTSGTESVTPTATGAANFALACTGKGGSANASTSVTVNALPPVVTISADQATIGLGKPVKLTWSSSNTTSCTASDSWSGAKAVSGTESVTPAAAGAATFTVSCTGSGGSANASAAVTVVPPPTVSITADRAGVVSGGVLNVTWTSTNATSCRGFGAITLYDKPTSGTEGVDTLDNPNVYTVTCTGIGGSTSASVTVPTGHAPTLIFTAPSPIILGDPLTLSWSSTNADTCTARGGWSGDKAKVGSENTTPTAPGSVDYTLTCSNIYGDTMTTRTVVVVKNHLLLAANDAGTISSYVISPTSGALTAVTGSPFAAHTSPRFVAADPSSRFAYVLNYGSADISMYSIDAATGTLTASASSPLATGANPSAMAIPPSGAYAYVVTAGEGMLTHLIETGGVLRRYLMPVPSPTTGIAIDLGGKFAFASGPTGIYGYSLSQPYGELDQTIAGSPFSGAAGNFLTMDPAGKFLYAANSGASTLSVYSINPNGGALTAVAGSPFATGKSPRTISIAPSGKFAYTANIGGPSDNGSISAFSIDANTGVLSPLAGIPFPSGDFPSSIAVDRSGKYAFVGSDAIHVYGIDATTGVLTEIAGSPFATSSYVTSLAVTP